MNLFITFFADSDGDQAKWLESVHETKGLNYSRVDLSWMCQPDNSELSNVFAVLLAPWTAFIFTISLGRLIALCRPEIAEIINQILLSFLFYTDIKYFIHASKCRLLWKDILVNVDCLYNKSFSNFKSLLQVI